MINQMSIYLFLFFLAQEMQKLIILIMIFVKTVFIDEI